jgi:hypothetical protein
MTSNKRKAAVAALITAGAIAVGAVSGGGLSSTQARRATNPPPWCGVICMGRDASGEPQELALRGRKAGKEQQESFLAIPGQFNKGSTGGGN